MNESENPTAIVFAGGKGKRMKNGEGIDEEFKSWPKPLVRGPEGKTMLSWTMGELMSKAGVGSFVFATSKDPEAEEELIQAYIRAFYGNSCSKIRADIDFSSEDSPLGTAGALNLALEKIKDKCVIATPVDTLFPFEKLREIPADHPGRVSIVWMVTSHIEEGQQNPGKILCDSKTGQVKYVLEGENPQVLTEEQKQGLNALTSGGVLLVNREYYLRKYPEYLKAHPDKEGKPVSVYGEFIRWLVETSEPIYTFDVKVKVMDLGRPEALAKLKRG